MLQPLIMLPVAIRHALAPIDEAVGRSRIAFGGSTSWGLFALEAARATLGWREEGGNNRGAQIEVLRNHRGPRGAWCAAGVSCWIHEGWAWCRGPHLRYAVGPGEAWGKLSARDRKACPVRRIHGARRLYAAVAAAGCEVDNPAPGDVALWARGPRGGFAGHIGLVSAVEGGRWSVIEGNVGDYPAEVAERDVTDRPRFLGWARLPDRAPLR